MKESFRRAHRTGVRPLPSPVGENGLGSEILSLLALVLGVFLAVSVSSFHGTDPSYFTHSSTDAIQNACGKIGAAWAAILLHGLGIGGFMVPFGLFFVGVELHAKRSRTRAWVSFAGGAAATLSLTVFASIQWQRLDYGGASLLVGGMTGAWLANALKAPLNPIGASIVSLGVFALAVVIATPFRISTFLSALLVSITGLARSLISGAAALLGWVSVNSAEWSASKSRSLWASLQERWMNRKKSETMIATSVDDFSDELGVEPSEEQTINSDEEGVDVWSSAPEEEDEKEEGSLRIVKTKEMMKDETVKSVSRAPQRKGAWKLPTIEFLKRPAKREDRIDEESLHENARLITQKLSDFSIEGQVERVTPGPVITLYEFLPDSRVKVSRIANLADDLAMALSAESIRILAPIPGKNVVGIEVPNEKREKVFLREFLEHSDFNSEAFEIPIAMGKDFSGKPLFSDLARMPHLLCAGQTGSGKSVFMNGLICSLLYRFTPDELRLILVDPKLIEFSAYQNMPHLLLPVVSEGKDASTALKWAVREMQRRYKILQRMGVRKLADYNAKVEKLGVDATRDLLYVGEETEDPMELSNADWMECFDLDEEGEPKIGKLPYIVIVIDELADLMQMARKDVEFSITRIAQKARAAGLHLVVATQRPSTDVITGLIKANLPSRTSFKLSSFIDSKTILDRAGAERLLGQGDMLFIAPGASSSMRLQGAYLQDDEIQKITSFLCEQGEPRYRQEILVEENELDEAHLSGGEDEDEFFSQAIDLGKRKGQISTSMVQREFRLGYNRAARIVDQMEELGYVGPADGARPRVMLKT